MKKKEEKIIIKANMFSDAIQKIRNHRPLFYSIILIALIIFAFFASNSYLYVQFLLGKDIIIKLSSDKENLNLERFQEANISFKASVTTNPFCVATCTSNFADVSEGNIIKKESFSLKAGSPLQLNRVIKITDNGEGQKLFRETLECQSESTTLCHTSGEKTSRSILVTVEYHLSDEETQLKEKLRIDIDNLKNSLSNSFSKLNITREMILYLDDKIIIDDLKTRLSVEEKNLNKNKDEFPNINTIWETQDFSNLNFSVSSLSTKIQESSNSISLLYNDVNNLITNYSQIIISLNETHSKLNQLRQKQIENASLVESINSSINNFNSIINLIKEKDTLDNKNRYSLQLREEILNLSDKLDKEIVYETLKKELDVDIEYNLLCLLNQTCIKRLNINERLNQTIFNLNETCGDIFSLNQLYNSLPIYDINKSNDTFLTSNNAKTSLSSLRQFIIDEYLFNISQNNFTQIGNIQNNIVPTNNDSIVSILLKKNYSSTPSLPNISLIPLMVNELKNEALKECNLLIVNNTLTELNLSYPTNFQLEQYDFNFNLSELTLKCCAFGKCKECCTIKECLLSDKNYPVVFLHGHSFNKAVAADYSLDAFNKIQMNLETDGYLNVGAVSLYTPPNMTPSAWGFPGIPISVKASYYFDIFQEPQNYVVIQTKSENIDTYSVRLNDLLKTIRYRTGKDKVVLITHSMGGLVARRYIQIFGGEDVDKLIMIGSPNHGVKGSIADYCSFIGEKLECNDLNFESLFINKVNRDKIPANIDVYNIAGVGCNMNGEDGDGVVLKDYATLDYVKNFYINGSCSGLDTLHTQMLNIEKYPEVYKIIKQGLNIS